MRVIQYTVRDVGRAHGGLSGHPRKPGTVQMGGREESWLCQGQEGNTMLSTFI